MDELRIQTKFCIVSPARLLHPAQLVVRHGRVVDVVQGRPYKPHVDLGETVLMPGLVNSHTHLEFSQLKQPFPAGENFPAWISQVVRYRAEQQAQGASVEPHTPARTSSHDAERRATLQAASNQSHNVQRSSTYDAERRATLKMGLQEAFCTGTALLGDIVTAPWMPGDYPDTTRFVEDIASRFSRSASEMRSPRLSGDLWREHLQPVMVPRVLPFLELIGLTAERCSASWQWSRQAQAASHSELQLGCGITPHAPYSLHLPTVAAALEQLSASTRVAMHVAESREELQWCEHQTGPFRDAFERLGLSTVSTPPSILECIDLLARFQYALLIHGNYLNQAQIERIAAAANIAVVYCPRTHVHFGHAPYPWQALRAAGVPVLLGTDSRASNPSLSLWDEVTIASKLHPQCSPSQWLESVTLAPARALGLADDFGSLQVGRWASAVALPARHDWTVDNLLEALCARSAHELAMRPLSAMLSECS